MKNTFLAALIFITIVTNAQPDKETPSASHYRVGYSVNQFQNDFGIGVNFITPYFIKQSVAIRVSATLHWLQHIPETQTEITWTAYQNYRVGVSSKRSWITNAIAVYGEGGLVMIVPNKEFSNQSVVLGGYGVFGFEFFLNQRFNYYIELGGIGTGATAEKSVSKPIYSNGFLVSVGFRANLGRK